ncbi:terminase small subunit [Enterobacter cloacae]|uniref:terminase small subunit n=1 Tax=Enterobacter cloacae TaxID=550 RepID=UPI00335955F2
MSKPDWGSLQQQYIAAHSRTGISPADWCEENGLKYATARRYIKKPPKNAQKNLRNSAQKTAQKDTAQTAQKRAKKNVENNPEKNAPIVESAIQEEIFDPDEFGISEQQGVFAQHVAMGKKLIDAYRLAGYKSEGNAASAGASQLLRNIKVSRAIRWLRDKRQKRLALTELEIIHQLSSIASADPGLISHIRRVNCRYCWGEDHHYQWRDVDEYERACASALTENKAPPSFEGGVGFVESTVPNEECPRCNGEGRMEAHFADTSMLDGPERWLVAGVEETMNGLKVRMVSQEAARRDLLKIIAATKNPSGVKGEKRGASEYSPDDYREAEARLEDEFKDLD